MSSASPSPTATATISQIRTPSPSWSATTASSSVIRLPTGEITPEANPNGALANIAGIVNENRNVLGMMPHPERCCEPELGATDGRAIFASMLRHAGLPVNA